MKSDQDVLIPEHKQIYALQLKLRQSHQKATELQRQKENLSATCRDQEFWIAEMAAELEKLQAREKQICNVRQQEEAEQLRQELAQARQVIDRLEKNLSAQKEALRSIPLLNRQAEKLTSAVSALIQQKENLTATCADQFAYISELTAAAEESHSFHKLAETQNHELQARLHGEQEERHKLQRELESAVRQLEAARQDAGQSAQDKQAIETRLHEQTARTAREDKNRHKETAGRSDQLQKNLMKSFVQQAAEPGPETGQKSPNTKKKLLHHKLGILGGSS